MRKPIHDAIHFAVKCEQFGITPSNMGRLVSLAEKAYMAGERECNYGYNAEPARRRFEKFAKSLGFSPVFFGLFPTLERDGVAYFLPPIG